jgi:hypothetical protein
MQVLICMSARCFKPHMHALMDSHLLVLTTEKGFSFCVTNAQIICCNKKGHCYIWTIEEGKMMAGILIIYICVIISWKVTCVIFNLGSTRASKAVFDAMMGAWYYFFCREDICAFGEGWHTCV